MSTPELEPIAVVGIACRLPGDVRTPSELWSLIENKRSTFIPIPTNRFNSEGFYHPHGQRLGSMNIPGGHFITSPPLSAFDAGFFHIRALEAKSMDPQQRMLLEVAWECFESAGVKVKDLAGQAVGVYVGMWTSDYADIQMKELDVEQGLWVTGTGRAIVSNRVSYVFDFLGPSMTIDTGCSSSGMALHLACQALRDPDTIAHSALVGGTNLFINPELAISMSITNVLSSTSGCKTFDEKADGYARGEGINCIYLKRLSDALRDGDPVRAVIRSSAINSDGKTIGLFSPSAPSQEACIREAYNRAGITDYNATAYFEAHGTGTRAGDPAEAKAIGNFFGPSRTSDDPLYVGSIKPNVGHGESSSALTGVVKAILALEADKIPPNINFDTPNPQIDFNAWKLKVPTEVLPWPAHKAKRASIGSSGYGGANSHVVLESLDYYLSSRPQLTTVGEIPFTKRFLSPHGPIGCTTPDYSSKISPSTEPTPRPFLLPFSANREVSLKQYIKNLAETLSKTADKNETVNLLDLAYTLGPRRSILDVRACGVFGTGEVISRVKLAEDLHAFTESVQCYSGSPKVRRLGFVFTGQGAQWAQMGITLLDSFPSVARCINRLEEVLAKLPDPPEWRITNELRKPADESRVNEPQVAQVLSTAIQVGLVDLLRNWGIKPDAVVGHSSGEIAAAYAAGTLKATEAIIIAYYRGKACTKAVNSGASDGAPRGGMLAVGLGREAVAPLLAPFEGKLVVACVNSPHSVTVSGDCDALEQLQKTMGEEGTAKIPIFNRRLKVPLAYHSHHMKPIGNEYQAMLEDQGISPRAGGCPMFSSVTAKVIKWSGLTPAYWRENLQSTVQFSDAVQELVKTAQVNTLLEIGPHSALSGPIREVRQHMGIPKNDLPYIPTLIRGQDSTKSVLESVGNLFVLGYTALDLEKVNSIETVNPETGKLVHTHGGILVDAPYYSWDHSQDFWLESRRSAEWRFRKHPRHDLLGSKVTGTDLKEWQWMNTINTFNTQWLKDHKVRGNSVMPAMVYVSMVIEALTQMLETIGKFDPHDAFYLREIYFQKPLIIEEHPINSIGTEVYTTLRPIQLNSEDESKWYEFRIRSTGVNGEPVKHSIGQICAGQRKQSSPLPPTEGKKFRNIEKEKFYRAMDEAGFDHGPAFRKLETLRANSDGFEMYAQAMNYIGGRTVGDDGNKIIWEGDAQTRPERDRRGSDFQGQAPNAAGTASPKTHIRSQNQEESSLHQDSCSDSPKIVLTPSTSSNPSIGQSDTGYSGEICDPGAPSSALKVSEISHEDRISLIRTIEANMPSHQAAVVTERLLQANTDSNVESRYAVHPVNLDLGLQLMFCTCSGGRLSKMSDAVVPTFIETIYVASAAPEASPLLDMYCTVDYLRSTTFLLTQCVSWDNTGQEIINISNMRAQELGQALHVQNSPNAADHFRLHWEIDFDFVDQGNFQRVLQINLPGDQNVVVTPAKDTCERQYFLLLLAMQALDKIRGLGSPDGAPAYMQRYRQWLEHLFSDEQQESIRTLCGKGGVNITLLSATERQQKIEALVSILQDDECKLAYEISQNIIPLFCGEKDPSSFNTSAHGSPMSNYETAFARVYSRKYPQKNVLEVGGGVGEGTKAILKGITRDAGNGVMERCFLSYTFTDGDSANVEKAKEKFSTYSGMNFVTLDIEKNLAEQGLEGNTDDMVDKTLHKAADIVSALENLAMVLRPGGKLVITETLGGQLGHIGLPFTMGVSPSWWRATEAHRQLNCLLSKEEWVTYLEASKFHLDLYQDDLGKLPGNTLMMFTYSPDLQNEPTHELASMESTLDKFPELGFSRPQESSQVTTQIPSAPPIVFLYRDSINPVFEEIASQVALSNSSHELLHASLIGEQDFPPDSIIVSLIDLEEPLFPTIKESEFAGLQRLCSRKDICMLWITTSVHLAGENPQSALINGFARSLRNELSLTGLRVLDISARDTESQAYWVNRFITLMSHLAGHKDLHSLDWEFCEYGGNIYIPRLVLDNHTRTKYSVHAHQNYTHMEPFRQDQKNLSLVCAQKGLLSSLIFKDRPLPELLEPDHVEIRCEVFGLNFKDLTTALGILPFQNLGTEAAGVVLRVGSEVTKLKPGDRVVCATSKGFSNKLQEWEGSCTRIPDELKEESFEDIIASNIVFLTVIRGLMHIARLRKGETVLIHSAAGGVGIAAIQIAKMLSAEIFATCGSPEKRQFLIEEHGIAADHIFSSRDTSFGRQIREKTNNRGIDVILNSLSGDLLHESWSCIASCGRFIEIGKRDIVLSGSLNMKFFDRNSTFSTVDLSELWLARNPVLIELMEELLQLRVQGKISPVRPMHKFSISDTEAAFRYMATGTHMGKIVITTDSKGPSDELVKVSSGSLPLEFEPRVSYLLVGGFGGIGSSLVVWMAENGAHHLCIMSRSGPGTSEAKKALKNIEAMGCIVQVMLCDVGDPEAVKLAIESAEIPIRGVIHAAMTLKDSQLEHMSYDDFKAPLHAKVTGLVNLHNSLAGHKLDFFVVLNSFSAVLGTPGQTNYSAAGTFQDAFVRYRHRLGLPATSINLGMVTEVGYVSRNPDIEKKLRNLGFTAPCTERQVQQLVRMAIDNPTPPPYPDSSFVHPQVLAQAQLVTGVSISSLGQMSQESTFFSDPKWSIVISTSLGISSSFEFEDEFKSHSNPLRDFEIRDKEHILDDICTCVIRKMSNLTGLPASEIKSDHSLKSYGMDSLVAVELKNWLFKVTKIELAVKDLLESSSILDLAQRVYAGHKPPAK